MSTVPVVPESALPNVPVPVPVVSAGLSHVFGFKLSY